MDLSTGVFMTRGLGHKDGIFVRMNGLVIKGTAVWIL